ncbi:MAG: VanZ family protein [Candidatus Woesebacteria bacterium GW2011_GWB1_45_5]|uniref:VanZ family protein n=1 Tax=Candidatus Woesebacteria bacterium GW2011_GWB1_45_5 TaxID=1618581 RepID=A0A0G1QKH7_9BACT|nr:MAG: VanZ family protein [Candidatus Woesebacteria bacterium GW2011_GWB1_45_5]
MKIRILKLLNYWLPPVVWATVIFLFSSLTVTPSTEIYWQDFIVKKTAHVVEYGIFAALLYRALRGHGVEKLDAVLLAILIAVIYGATDEFHQSFTPGREPRVRDVVFDTIGAVTGVFICKKYL